MSEKMRNPYESEEGLKSEVTLSQRWCIITSLLFFIAISVPPLWRTANEFSKPASERWIPIVEIANTDSVEAANVLREKRKLSSGIERTEPSIRDHLQAFERGVKDADFRNASRRVDQARQLLWLRDGNRKVHLGSEGWLYYQPELDALTGYGPLRPEPDSVIKNPDRAQWNPARAVVLKFAEQLKERGIRLTLVPVPTKPMIQPEGVTGKDGEFLHPDYGKLLGQFRESGIEVIDLIPTFREMKNREPVFLRQDTHWTSPAMKVAATFVAKSVSLEGLSKSLETKVDSVPRESKGDLVEMLGLSKSVDYFDPEPQTLNRILDRKTGKPVASDSNSPLVVIGDSFVNIYEDPSIGFGDGESKDTI